MINPDTITIGHDVIIEEGVVILPCYNYNNSHILEIIYWSNTELNDAIIENDTVKHSLIYDSYISSRSKIGPFFRDKSHIGEENRIGNFVEVKKSTTGNNTKASHLSYIGDATMGKN